MIDALKPLHSMYLGRFFPSYNIYITGTAQVVTGVHPLSACVGRPCVIHNPSDHHMQDWPTHWREDRHMMERLCPHGVGHPDPDDITEDTVHGCDGCCLPPLD